MQNANSSLVTHHSGSGSQLGAAGPRVPVDFFFAGLYRLASQHLVNLTVPKRVFYQAILERMKTDHHRPATRLENSRQDGQQAFQGTQLIVDSDSKRLKRARRRIDPLASGTRHTPSN